MLRQCLCRCIKHKDIEYFGDNYHRFYIESRCTNTFVDDDINILCNKCRNKKIDFEEGSPSKYKSETHVPLYHGIIGGPLPYWSHVYDSPWYNLKVISSGLPTEEAMNRAKKAKKDVESHVDISKINPELIQPVALVSNGTKTKTNTNNKNKIIIKRKKATKPVEAPVVNIKAIEYKGEQFIIDDTLYIDDNNNLFKDDKLYGKLVDDKIEYSIYDDV